MLNITNKIFTISMVLFLAGAIFSCSSEPTYDEWEINPEILPPTTLTASINSSGGIVLSWTDNTALEDDYRIERSLDTADNFAEIGTVEKDVSIYSDSTVTVGNSYYYRVRAHSTNGSSQYSNQALVKMTEDVPVFEIALAKVEIEIDIDGMDTIEVENGKMRIDHNSGDNPPDPKVQVYDWSGSSWEPKWSPYDVWELAWDSASSNQFDMVLSDLVPEEFNKIKNLKMIKAHCDIDDCGGVFLKEGSDNEIVFADTTVDGHGVYKIEFEYWYSVESGSSEELTLSMAKIEMELDVDGEDIFTVYERYKMFARNAAGANPEQIKIWAYRVVDGEEEAVFPNPYYKTWAIQWDGGVSSDSSDFDLELYEVASGKFRRLANLEVLSSHNDGVDWTQFYLDPTNRAITVDDMEVTGHGIVKFAFEYWYMK